MEIIDYFDLDTSGEKEQWWYGGSSKHTPFFPK